MRRNGGIHPVQKSVYGLSKEGVKIHRFTLRRENLTVRILEYGATIESIEYQHSGVACEICKRLNSLAEYESNMGYVGATVGPIANRLSGSAYPLDGKMITLSPNEGRNHLHGGPGGFHQMTWHGSENVDVRGPSVRLECVHEHGTDGYVGTAYVRATYTLDVQNVLHVEYEAVADHERPISLTSHSYFSLPTSEQSRSNEQLLQIFTDRFLEVDAEKLPTGVVSNVDDGRGFRNPTPISGLNLDTTFVFPTECEGLRHQAVLTSDLIKLTVASNQPALQVYLDHESDVRSWVCLEPHGYTDAPNHTHFPSIMLPPNVLYRFGMSLALGPSESF